MPETPDDSLDIPSLFAQYEDSCLAWYCNTDSISLFSATEARVFLSSLIGEDTMPDPAPAPTSTPTSNPAPAPAIDSDHTDPALGCCGGCGDEVPVGELTEAPNGTLLCDSCCDELVCRCRGCDTEFMVDDMDLAINSSTGTLSQHRCSNCNFVCAMCEDRVYGDSTYVVGWGDVCGRCFDSHCVVCDDCSEVIHTDSARARGEDRLCRGCARARDEDDPPPEDDEDEGPRHSHDYRPPLIFRDLVGSGSVFHHAPQKKLVYFGLEIEVEFPAGWGLSSAASSIARVVGDEKQWFGKYDGSLDNGIEFVSHPCTLAYWRKTGFPWTTDLRARGFRSYHTRTCGAHIHVSRCALPKSDWVKLAFLFRNNADLIRRMGRRDLNNYCAVHASEDTPTLMRKVLREGFPVYREDRYQALNFVPSNTVEFRMFRGTLSETGLLRNLECVNALLEFARATPHPNMTESDFILWLTTSARSTPSIGPKRADMLRAWLDPNAPVSLLERWRNSRATHPIHTPTTEEQ